MQEHSNDSESLNIKSVDTQSGIEVALRPEHADLESLPVIGLKQPAERKSAPPYAKLLKVAAALCAVAMVAYLSIFAMLKAALKDWSTAQLEQVVSRNLNRKVSLGQAHWHLGWRGVVFKSNHMTISELDCKPFVDAKSAEITAELLPLLHQEVVLTSLEFNKPEVWAVKHSDGKWNFADLPELPSFKDLRYLALHKGLMHVTDEGTAGNNRDIDAIEVSLDNPLKCRTWPFSISFVTRGARGALMKASIKGVGTGVPDDWQKNTHKMKLEATNVDPGDLRLLWPDLPPVTGPIDLSFSGSGIPKETMKGAITLKTPLYNAILKDAEVQGLDAFFGQDVPESQRKLSIGMRNSNFSLADGAADLKEMRGTAVIAGDTVQLSNVTAKLGSGTFTVSGVANGTRDVNLTCNLKDGDVKSLKKLGSGLSIRSPLNDVPFEGRLKQIEMVISGSAKNPSLMAILTPKRLRFVSPNKMPPLIVSGGRMSIDGNAFSFRDLSGNIGKGSFILNGTGNLTDGMQAGANTQPTLPARMTGDLKLAAWSLDIDELKEFITYFKVNSPLLKTASDFKGRVRSVEGVMKGDIRNPLVSLSLTPDRIVYNQKEQPQLVINGGGTVALDGQRFTLRGVSGTVAGGTYRVDGTGSLNKAEPLDVMVFAERLKLDDVARLAHAVAMPDAELLTSLSGAVKKTVLHVTGTLNKPYLSSLSAEPDRLVFHGRGQSLRVEITSGKLSYKGGTLVADQLKLKLPHGAIALDGRIDHAPKNGVIENFKVSSPGCDLQEIDRLLTAADTPVVVKQLFGQLKAQQNLSNPCGRFKGSIAYERAHQNLSADIQLDAAGADIGEQKLSNISGHLRANSGDLQVERLSGLDSGARFDVQGTIKDFANASSRLWNLHADARFSAQGLSRFAGNHLVIRSDSDNADLLTVRADINGNDNEPVANITAAIDNEAQVVVETPYTTLRKRKGQRLTVAGKLRLNPQSVDVNDLVVAINDVPFKVKGTYFGSIATGFSSQDRVDLQIDSPDYVAASELVALMVPTTSPRDLANIAGGARGQLELKGTVTAPTMRGHLVFKDCTLPALHISHLSGEVDAPEFMDFAQGGQGERKADIKISSLMLNKLPVKNLQGNVMPLLTPHSAGVRFKDMHGDVAGGAVVMSGQISPDDKTQVKVLMKDLHCDVLVKELFNAKDEITGLLNGVAMFRVTGSFDKDFAKRLSAKGDVTVSGGRVKRFSELERKINQANLFEGGILGFNLNNLIAAVAPAKTGYFETLSATYQLSQGKFNIRGVNFNGKELKIRASGSIDLNSQDINIEVAGNIPRISPSGPLGAVAPYLSVHGIASLFQDFSERIFKEQVEKAPPRAFAFKIAATTKDADTVAQSIYKTFHWLPNKAGATAHPVLEAANAGSSPAL